jgi:transcriptional regulator with XRE-family HTH domain
MSEDDKKKHPVDRHVGLRMRIRRQMKRMSQEQLAESLGVTFQQVQKYENGSNRVSASRLFDVSRALEAPINYFFEGLIENNLPGVAEEGADFIYDFLSTPEGVAVATAFPRIKNAAARKRILDLIRSLADEDEDASKTGLVQSTR